MSHMLVRGLVRGIHITGETAILLHRIAGSDRQTIIAITGKARDWLP
jgi:hypothetical protein